MSGTTARVNFSTKVESSPLWNTSTGTRRFFTKSPIFITGSKEDCLVEVALQYNDTYAENVFSFANSINTTEGERT